MQGSTQASVAAGADGMFVSWVTGNASVVMLLPENITRPHAGSVVRVPQLAHATPQHVQRMLAGMPPPHRPCMLHLKTSGTACCRCCTAQRAGSTPLRPAARRAPIRRCTRAQATSPAPSTIPSSPNCCPAPPTTSREGAQSSSPPRLLPYHACKGRGGCRMQGCSMQPPWLFMCPASCMQVHTMQQMDSVWFPGALHAGACMQACSHAQAMPHTV